MVNTSTSAKINQASPHSEKRNSERINSGDIVNGVTVDPVFRSYIPFRAKVINISETGVQLAVKKGTIQAEEGTKILVTPPAAKEKTGSTRETVVIWCKTHGEATILGCMFAER